MMSRMWTTFAVAFTLAGAPVSAVWAADPGNAPADAAKTGVGPRGTKIAPSTDPSSETHSTATPRPPGVPEGTSAAQLPTNSAEAKTQPPTTTLKPKGP
jgi:hypothetical protein